MSGRRSYFTITDALLRRSPSGRRRPKMSENTGSCAATTTIREALERYAATATKPELSRIQASLAALVLLEQLVEAAQRVGEVEKQSVSGKLDKERTLARRELAAAVAAVGPGQETK